MKSSLLRPLRDRDGCEYFATFNSSLADKTLQAFNLPLLYRLDNSVRVLPVGAWQSLQVLGLQQSNWNLGPNDDRVFQR